MQGFFSVVNSDPEPIMFIDDLQWAVILLPAHPASFAHKFLFQRVPGYNSMADLSSKIVVWTH